ncbi:PREDICTED: uncharacterized protein LOC109127487 [Camelina sativa]|uniref:Uncharacterized protein LOC109127487 n=1 Tax=Camelina sativa TaxID=90675 RepID=A0ABM1QM83_CAMSA|nr:PREDICTED: uncharacterized protein LOC109127487 [Camelina sativa]
MSLYIYGFVSNPGVKQVMKMVKCQKLKHRRRKGRKENSKFRETYTQRNLRILRKIVPGCEEIEDEEALFRKSIEHVMLLKSQVTLLRKIADVCGV